MLYLSVYCCYNKIPESGYLIKEKTCLAYTRRLKIQAKVAPSVWVLVRALLATSQHGGQHHGGNPGQKKGSHDKTESQKTSGDRFAFLQQPTLLGTNGGPIRAT